MLTLHGAAGAGIKAAKGVEQYRDRVAGDGGVDNCGRAKSQQIDLRLVEVDFVVDLVLEALAELEHLVQTGVDKRDRLRQATVSAHRFERIDEVREHQDQIDH